MSVRSRVQALVPPPPPPPQPPLPMPAQQPMASMLMLPPTPSPLLESQLQFLAVLHAAWLSQPPPPPPPESEHPDRAVQHPLSPPNEELPLHEEPPVVQPQLLPPPTDQQIPLPPERNEQQNQGESQAEPNVEAPAEPPGELSAEPPSSPRAEPPASLPAGPALLSAESSLSPPAGPAVPAGEPIASPPDVPSTSPPVISHALLPAEPPVPLLAGQPAASLMEPLAEQAPLHPQFAPHLSDEQRLEMEKARGQLQCSQIVPPLPPGQRPKITSPLAGPSRPPQWSPSYYVQKRRPGQVTSKAGQFGPSLEERQPGTPPMLPPFPPAVAPPLPREPAPPLPREPPPPLPREPPPPLPREPAPALPREPAPALPREPAPALPAEPAPALPLEVVIPMPPGVAPPLPLVPEQHRIQAQADPQEALLAIAQPPPPLPPTSPPPAQAANGQIDLDPAAQYRNAVRMHPPLPPALQPRPAPPPSPQPGSSTSTTYYSALLRPLGPRSVAEKRAADSTTDSPAKVRCLATDRNDPRCSPECFRCMRRVLRNAIYRPPGAPRNEDGCAFIRFGHFMLFIVADRNTFRELADNNIELV